MVEKIFDEIRPSLYCIRDDMFPLYLVRADKNVLIDCSILAKAEEIEKKLRMILGPQNLDLVLITHSHYDHVGACPYLQQIHRFQIVTSARTKEILESDRAIELIDRLNQDFQKILTGAVGRRFQKPVQILEVKEGDTIAVAADGFFEVYETPGHTRCSISFLLMPQKILFPGDAAGVVEKDGKIKPLFLSSYKKYERSLEKLRELGCDTLALPHNRWIRGEADIRVFLERALDAARELKEELVTVLKDRSDVEGIADSLLAREFSHPAVMGPREAYRLNLIAMIRTVQREFFPSS